MSEENTVDDFGTDLAKQSEGAELSEGAGQSEAVSPVQESVDETSLSDDEQRESDSNSDLAEAKSVRLSLSCRLSAMLFAATKPLTEEALAKHLGIAEENISLALLEAQTNFSAELHGFSLEEVAGAWQFRTHPAAATSIQKLIPVTARKLSRAASETLAAIAYKQPVQRAEIEAIRGVDCLATLKTLLDAKLIRIVGRESSAGQAALYGTTNAFLEKFGLEDLSQLPTPREAQQLAEEEGEIDLEDFAADDRRAEDGSDEPAAKVVTQATRENTSGSESVQSQ